MNALKVFALVAGAQFRPFTQSDWDCYAGCDSASPMIAEVSGNTLIIDGDVLHVYAPDETFWQVSLAIEEI